MKFDPFNCRITIRSNPEGLTFPKNMTKKEGEEFLKEVLKWIEEKNDR